MKLHKPKIEIESLSKKETETYNALDSNKYGEVLAQQVANKLAENSNNGLYHSHKYYCGLGLFFSEEGYTLNTVDDGCASYVNNLIITFLSKTEFVEWLSKENDQSMSLYSEKFNNQTITKTRLKWYLEDGYSPIWNAYCLYLRGDKHKELAEKSSYGYSPIKK
ncbi:hypothetical protein [uncultured Maribacter sp.]|uniref:hypothetical protein n=1 Tax=uncultured Maribacter sp. TaxID=431308 RepID=UPI0026099114|nr:hypothetical protein [uncultured Maribacter sp.]